MAKKSGAEKEMHSVFEVLKVSTLLGLTPSWVIVLLGGLIYVL